MDIKRLIGRRIKEIRLKRGLKQETVAEMVGIDTVSLSNIERGKYYPTADNLDKILFALNITPSDMFYIEHLQDDSILLEEINRILLKNPDRIKDIYKIIKAII